LAKIAKRALVAAVALAAIVYGVDYGALRLRAAYPRFGGAYDSVHMTRLLAIPLKSGRTEYELDARQPEVTVTCVRTLSYLIRDINRAGMCGEIVRSPSR